ncbi:hypothetical protein A3Q56_06072 [Intoshia linei]|uniref:Deoxynucleoside kinase domain-containing protein n=1 Tax=Intoshia linei TaxID=1819745 RepID=A0A177AW13_9BILA|nr:hypothetical protein A3Q56_06072 [Intoshia linei]
MIRNNSNTINVKKFKFNLKFLKVVVEGNIGCGKSTFLEYYSNDADIELLSYRCNLYHIDSEMLKKIKMMERSLLSDRHVFIENLIAVQILTNHEYTILDKWYNKIMESESVPIDVIIYLRASPEKCLQRIRERSRPEEKGISLNFLKKLHTLHDKWLLNTANLVGTPTIYVIDAKRGKEYIKSIINSIKKNLINKTVKL